MWRHCATCGHCGQKTSWNEDREVSEQEIFTHLQNRHKIRQPLDLDDYQVDRQRQCDSCLEPYLDDCTKCRQDFCQFHAGDIDGLCGGCI
jgi:predicted small metal-binding protein